jgi:hypothetical protein
MRCPSGKRPTDVLQRLHLLIVESIAEDCSSQTCRVISHAAQMRNQMKMTKQFPPVDNRGDRDGIKAAIGQKRNDWDQGPVAISLGRR